MGDASIKGRSPLLSGGRVGFSRAGPVGNLPWVRGTSRPGVRKAPRGAEHKEAIKQEQKLQKLKFKKFKKIITKTPDKQISKAQKKKIIKSEAIYKAKNPAGSRAPWTSPIKLSKGGKV
tara:strand:+ start:367 stop:723 length:357 start_codon:yes stop_codon:yes gene_type:complete